MAGKVLSGGDKIKRALEDIARKMGGGAVSVGFLSNATYPDGTPVAAVAYWNEFGHGATPPRPFFRKMIAKESRDWPKRMAALAKATGYDGKQTLGLMGEDIAGALQQSIIETDSPALSPTTLLLRKRFWTNRSAITWADVAKARADAAAGEPGATGTQAKPLVWTGDMKNSVAYKVDE